MLVAIVCVYISCKQLKMSSLHRSLCLLFYNSPVPPLISCEAFTFIYEKSYKAQIVLFCVFLSCTFLIFFHVHRKLNITLEETMQNQTKCPYSQVSVQYLYLYLNLILSLWWWPTAAVREEHKHRASMCLSTFSLEVFQTPALPLKMLCFSPKKTQITSLKN